MAALRTSSHLPALFSFTANGNRRAGRPRGVCSRLAGVRLRMMMLRRIFRVRASGADVLKTSSVTGKRRFKLCRFLPPLNGDIDISRLVFDSEPYAPDFFGRKNGRTRTCELIEHSIAARRTIEQRVGDERDRFYSGMGGKRLQPIPAERVDAWVSPNVGAIAAEAAQIDIASMRSFADSEDADGLMLRTVE